MADSRLVSRRCESHLGAFAEYRPRNCLLELDDIQIRSREVRWHL